MQPHEIVSRFLSSIGHSAEAEYYVSLFREERESFALIAVDPGVVADAAGALAVDLRFLDLLDLSPVLALPDRSDADALSAEVEPEVGCRVVEPEQAAAWARRHGVPLVPLEGRPLTDLVALLNSRKVVLLGLRSGLVCADGRVPSLVDLTNEYAELAAPDVLPPAELRQLERARQIIEAAEPRRLTVAITSPLDLLRELFTVRGAGTLFRRGATITRLSSYQGADIGALTELMTSAFGKPPPPDFFSRPIQWLYIADDYRGAAVIAPTRLGPYLSKFAVEQRARGEGIGRDLWGALTADSPALFWRSRPENPIVPWYEQHCDGLYRTPRWHVFWRGLLPASVPAAIDHALSRPVDFSPPQSGGQQA